MAQLEIVRKFHQETWSSESEDLETPLEIWKKLHQNSLQESRDHPGCTKPTDKSKPTIKSNLKRKSRRLLSKEGRKFISSSDSESNDDVKPSLSVRQTRSKSRAKYSRTARKDDNSSMAQKTDLLGRDAGCSDKHIVINKCKKDPTGVVSQTASKKRKQGRVLRRSTRKQRKSPVHFIDNDDSTPGTNSCGSNRGSSPPSEDDSQKTILLDTPEFANSYQLAVDSLNKKGEGNSAPSRLDVDGKSESDSIAPLCEQDKTSRFPMTSQSLKLNPEKDKDVPVEQTHPSPHSKDPIKLESTEVDDIFFKSHGLSPKKPPPSRSLKKSDKPTAHLYKTNVSQCSSLLDDDSLWNTK